MSWSTIRTRLKSNLAIHTVVVQMKKVYFYHLKRYYQEFQGFKRKHTETPYSSLTQFKDKYKEKRCFIVCTGPSLTFEDLSAIKGEYSFGMNSITKVFDKTDWRPTFYGIQDKHVYEKMKDNLLSMDLGVSFISDEIVKEGYEVPKNSNIFPLNFYGHEYFNFDHPRFKFSKDITSNVYDGFSITYSLMQIAYYMGFKDVYLLGCDCSYAKDPSKQHFVSSGHIDPNAAVVGSLQSMAYEKAKEFCSKNNFHIYNATRGGYLEIFDRVQLEEVLK